VLTDRWTISLDHLDGRTSTAAGRAQRQARVAGRPRALRAPPDRQHALAFFSCVMVTHVCGCRCRSGSRCDMR
jgi:hypothetical protein